MRASLLPLNQNLLCSSSTAILSVLCPHTFLSRALLSHTLSLKDISSLSLFFSRGTTLSQWKLLSSICYKVMSPLFRHGLMQAGPFKLHYQPAGNSLPRPHRSYREPRTSPSSHRGLCAHHKTRTKWTRHFFFIFHGLPSHSSAFTRLCVSTRVLQILWPLSSTNTVILPAYWRALGKYCELVHFKLHRSELNELVDEEPKSVCLYF